MNVDAEIVSRLEGLVQLGQQVLETRRTPPRNTMGFPASVDSQLANKWFTKCLNLLSRVFGQSSVHFKNMEKYYNEGSWKFGSVDQAHGVLLAAKEDYETGSLFDIKLLVEADLFEEILEQADYLLESGYLAAAVVAGCVLEDGLRRLCERHQIDLPNKPKLDWMNGQLAKADAYNKFRQKDITAMADLRNNAAHGKWDEIKAGDVERMLSSVRDFMEHSYA